MPAVYKMIATVMLQNGFELGFGSGRNSLEIIEPTMIPVKGARYGSGYIPIGDDMKTKKKNDHVLAKPISHFYQPFPVRQYAEHDDLGKRICGLFEEIDVVIEKEVELAGFHDAEPGEILQNQTSMPILIPRTLGRRASFMHISIGGSLEEA